MLYRIYTYLSDVLSFPGVISCVTEIFTIQAGRKTDGMTSFASYDQIIMPTVFPPSSEWEIDQVVYVILECGSEHSPGETFVIVCLF